MKRTRIQKGLKGFTLEISREINDLIGAGIIKKSGGKSGMIWS